MGAEDTTPPGAIPSPSNPPYVFSVELKKSMDEWVDPRNWPEPKWFATMAAGSKLRYEDYFAHQLRMRYVELESEFRAIFGNFLMGSLEGTTVDVVTSERVVCLLHIARRALESKEPDLLAASNTLNLIERFMVWLTPSYMLVAEMPALRLLAESLPERERNLFSEQLNQFHGKIDSLSPEPRALLGLRPLYDEVISLYNQHTLKEQIGSGLQIRRLRTLRVWGLLVLPVNLVAMPLLIPLTEAFIDTWSQGFLGETSSASRIWLLSLGIAMMGALGGFLSGLLQVRSSRVTLTEYQDSMLKLQLRPLVGAIVSLLLFSFLSWDLLPGFKIENPGSYFFVAFLSGFSERYFLRLMEIDQSEIDARSQTGGTGGAPMASPSVPVGSTRNE